MSTHAESNDQMRLTHRVRDVDARHFDELFARRVELITAPSAAGQPALSGRVVFHTVWLHYRDGAVFAETPGPRLEYAFEDILARVWDVPVEGDTTVQLPTLLMMGGLKVAFDTLANEYLTPVDLESLLDPE